MASTSYDGAKGGRRLYSWRRLDQSFSVTVMTNMPCGVIMMTTDEWLHGMLEDGLYGIPQKN
jgi:hypothetical protein